MVIGRTWKGFFSSQRRMSLVKSAHREMLSDLRLSALTGGAGVTPSAWRVDDHFALILTRLLLQELLMYHSSVTLPTFHGLYFLVLVNSSRY